MKKKWFSNLGYTNAPKNNLHKAFTELLKTNNHVLIHDKDAFIKHLQEDLAKINAAHSRCKPLTLTTWKHEEDVISFGTSGAYGRGFDWDVNFHLYAVTKEFKNQ